MKTYHSLWILFIAALMSCGEEDGNATLFLNNTTDSNALIEDRKFSSLEDMLGKLSELESVNFSSIESTSFSELQVEGKNIASISNTFISINNEVYTFDYAYCYENDNVNRFGNQEQIVRKTFLATNFDLNNFLRNPQALANTSFLIIEVYSGMIEFISFIKIDALGNTKEEFFPSRNFSEQGSQEYTQLETSGSNFSLSNLVLEHGYPCVQVFDEQFGDFYAECESNKYVTADIQFNCLLEIDDPF